MREGDLSRETICSIPEMLIFDKTVFWSNKKKQARANIDLMCVKNIRRCLVKVVLARLLLLYAVSSECVSIKRLVSWHS